MSKKVYVTYEEPYAGQKFTEEEFQNIYKIEVNKEEYPTFEDWKNDMLRSGVFSYINKEER